MKWIRSFSFRLVVTTLLAFIFSIALVVALVSVQYRTAMKEKDEVTTIQAFEVVERNIISMLTKAGNAALKIQQNKAVDAYLYDTHQSELERVVASRRMMNAISEQLRGTDELYGVLFFKSDASVVGAMVPWRFSFESEEHPFYEQVGLGELPLGTGITWLGAYPGKDFTLRDSLLSGSGDVLLIGANKTRFKYDEQGDDAIILLAAVSNTALSSLFDYLGDDHADIYLLDAQGKQISGPDSAQVNVRPAFADAMTEYGDEGSFAWGSGDESMQIIHYSMQELNWTLVKTVPMKIYNEPTYRLLKMTVLITALAVITVCVLYIYWLTRFLKPFKIIVSDLERVRKGDISVRMHERFDIVEFEELRLGTNRMIESVSGMIQHTKEIERSRADLTLRNLQMQINPHMVFNTISAIRWMATFSGANTVADMLMELAELIRPIYSEWRLRWTVREELDYIRHYMRLIELRYGAGFQMEIDVDEELMDAMIPLFTLQPLMENSCEHGSQNRKKLNIRIGGCKKEGYGVLTIQDDGCGIAPDMLETLRNCMQDGKQLTGKQLRHTGMGIVNIDKRVKMFSDQDCGLNIESVLDEGTTISVRFAL